MDLDWIRRLLELVDDSDVDTLEIRRFGTHVRVSKSPPVAGGSGPARVASAAGDAGAGGPVPAAPAGGGPAAGGGAGMEGGEAESGEAGGDEDLYAVSSPMVGTFYRAPAPDAPPYVEVGDRVRKGQTLCILEAMKLMNELESEVAGVIREISVENSEPVEYGQVLFRIEVDGKG
ncbi:MAG TPA: acetyl-CoA carboxylase biotin carboxyl carrier protein [Gemmatimonadota bacterium]|nr:acetyl-CoA carboxylase biotin carboxyl carrier protein [Gemmatimonadota bacterium]